MSPHIFEEPY